MNRGRAELPLSPNLKAVQQHRPTGFITAMPGYPIAVLG